MPEHQDVELGQTDTEYKETYEADTEREALLPGTNTTEEPQPPAAKVWSPVTACSQLKPHFAFRHLVLAFLAGGLASLLTQVAFCGTDCFSRTGSGSLSASGSGEYNDLVPPYVGSTEVHHFPPTAPTNAFPSMFPSNIGHAGPTPTGAEPAIIATAPSYPLHTGAAQLVPPPSTVKSGSKKGGFDLFRLWGNLSPWYSIEKGKFGVDSGPEAPDTCRVTGLHFLHRHGARYPTKFGEHCARPFW